MNKKIFLTQKGLDDLKKEYDDLLKIKRPLVVKRLSNARDMGDLSENAEYTAARDELALIDNKAAEMEELLKKATLINNDKNIKKGTGITLGSSVTLKINNKEETFTIVGEWESDPAKKKISNESPLGKALIGKSKGEEIEISAPAGKMIYKVVSIK